jgi:hypothetical protein
MFKTSEIFAYETIFSWQRREDLNIWSKDGLWSDEISGNPE